MNLNDKQVKRVDTIIKRFQQFKYGLGQADHDIRFLLTLITGEDPTLIQTRFLKKESKRKIK